MASTTSPSSQTLQFLGALFAQRPAGTVVAVVQLPNAATAHGYSALEPVVDRVLGRAECYVAACALARGPGRGKRTAELAAYLPGAWVDLDVNGSPVRGSDEPVSGHAPSWEAAVEAAFALAWPTFAVASGYGLQPWWLLEDGGYAMHNAAEQERGRRLVHGLQRRLAYDAGWKVDSTADLARVMRVPGTVNDKDPARPVPVRLLDCAGPRYSLEQLERLGAAFADDQAVAGQRDGEPRPVEDWARLLHDGAGDGERHETIWALSGYLLRRGLDPLVAYEVVRAFNDARVRPAYDEATVRKHFKGIARLELKRRRGEFEQAWAT